MGLGKTPTMLAHLLAGAGAGPTLVIAPAAVVGNWAAEAARFTPGLRVVVHHGANRAAADEIAAEVARRRRRDHDVRHRRARRRRDRPTVEWSHAGPRRGPGDQEPRERHRAAAPADPGAHAGRARPARPSRTVSAISGRSSTSPIPGLVGPRPQFIAQLSREGDAARRRRGRAARAQRDPRLPAHQGRAGDRRRAARSDRRARPLRDDARADRSVPGRARQAGRRPPTCPTARSRARARSSPRSPRSSRSATIPSAYQDDDRPLAGRSGKLARLEEIVEAVFAAGERVLVFTHFAEWGQKLATHLTEVTGTPVACYHGGLTRTARDRMIDDFQTGAGPGALVLSLKAGGTGLNLTAANHVVLYDRWWNPAVEDQARDRAWRIGQTHTVISHRLVCPGTVDERVEEVVAGKRRIARPRAAEVELARRPRHRTAPDRARHPSRHRARRGSRPPRGRSRMSPAPPSQVVGLADAAPRAQAVARLLGPRPRPRGARRGTRARPPLGSPHRAHPVPRDAAAPQRRRRAALLRGHLRARRRARHRPGHVGRARGDPTSGLRVA